MRKIIVFVLFFLSNSFTISAVESSWASESPGVYVFEDYWSEDPVQFPFIKGGIWDRTWLYIENHGGFGPTNPAQTPVADSIEAYIRSIAGDLNGNGGHTLPGGGKEKAMIDIVTHDGGPEEVLSWGKGGDQNPNWVYQAPYNTRKITFTKDGKNYQFPDYTDPNYLRALEAMIRNFAAVYDGDPRIEAIMVGGGIYGESYPYRYESEPEAKTAFFNAGVNGAGWINFNRQLLTLYKRYFIRTPLIFSLGKHYGEGWGGWVTGREMTDEAIRQKYHIAWHGNEAEPSALYIANGYTGFYAAIKDYCMDAVGIPEPRRCYYESGNNPGFTNSNQEIREKYAYWEVLTAISHQGYYFGGYGWLKRSGQPDMGMQIPLANLVPVFNFFNDYAGKYVSNSPGVWIAFRKETPNGQGPWNTQVDATYTVTIPDQSKGNSWSYHDDPPSATEQITRTITTYANYGQWLTQFNPDGTTVGLYNIGAPSANPDAGPKEGKFARRTILASGKDSFYLQVNDSYISPSSIARFDTSASGTSVNIFVTYLDAGTGSFEVRYDSYSNSDKLAGTVTKTNTNAWKRANFAVNDAYFGGRMTGNLGDKVDLKIKAIGNDITLHMVEIRKITLVAFDFSLSNSGGISVTQGSSATNTITSTLVSGSSQPASFSVSGLPSGTTYSFSPASCNPTCSTILTISTSATTPAGTYTITITGTGGSVSKTTILSLTVTSLQIPYGGSPFTIPGTIQAEDFDNGGEGIAYHDLDTSNNGGQYRNTGVDIEATLDTGGGYNVGWMKAGEWLEYSVNVLATGDYTLNARVASTADGGTFHVEFDGVDKTGTMTIYNTGGWQVWQTISKTFRLDSGNYIMRIMLDSNSPNAWVGNINYISFVAAPTCSSMSYPSDKWQRVWYKTSDNTCLGNGPNKTSVKFDDNWGIGVIAYSTPDKVKFVSSRAIALGAGSYRFTLGSDDGSRLYIDDVLVISNWADQPYTVKSYTATWDASSTHNFRIEWYENAGLARISFDYASVDACGAANKVGIHTMVQDAGDIDQHLDWAKALVGSGGYVKQLFYPVTTSTQGPQQRWIDFVNKAYQRDLIPIIRLQGDCCWIKPDSSNSYQNIAQAFKRVVQGLPKSDKYPLYIEIWNEPNLNGEWSGSSNPTEYANFHVAVYNAIKSIGDSRIKVLNGALAPGSSNGKTSFQWLEDALNANSGFKDSFDVWASHPYAGNHPPEYSDGKTPSNTNDNYHIKGYEWELAVLAGKGRSNVNVIATEAGYQYSNRDDVNYPAIDENNRADFTVRAFRDYWIPDTRVIAVTPFEMLDPNNQIQWQSWNWLNNDGSPKKVYTDVKNFRASCGSIASPAQYGIQIDVQASEKIPSTNQFQALNPAWARYVFRPSNPLPSFPSSVNRLVIFNGESASPAPHGSTDVNVWRNYVDSTYLPGLNDMLTSYPGAAAIEIWNEEDICPSPSFCPGIPAQAYAYMLRKSAAAIKAKNSSIKVIMGGLASGQASYITNIINADSLALGQVDAVGLHPYGKSPNGWCASGCSVTLFSGDLAASVNEYKNAASLPVWITEIGQGTTDRNWQADYLTRVFNVLSNNNVPVVNWYAWIDSMTGGDGLNVWGLYDDSGNIKASGTAFRAFTVGTKLYTSPEPSASNSDITVTATSDTPCANVGTTSAGFSNCRNLQCCSNPTSDGNQYGWSWTCTTSSIAGTYTTAFTGDQAGCSATRSFTVQAADTSPPATSIFSVEGDTSAPYYIDNTDNSKTDIVINGEAGMACRIYDSDIAYSDSSGALCTASGTQATCTVSTANGNSYTRYIACKDSAGNGQSASQNLVVAWAVSYQCSDGTNYGQCSATKPKYCDSGSLVNKCSVCGCDSGQVCQNDNCVQSTSLDRISVIMTKLANFAIPIRVELYNADNNALLGSAVVSFGQNSRFDVQRADFRDAGGNSITIDRSIYPRLYVLFKSPVLFGVNRFYVP